MVDKVANAFKHMIFCPNLYEHTNVKMLGQICIIAFPSHLRKKNILNLNDYDFLFNSVYSILIR